MNGRIPVFIHAEDPISEAGLASQLRRQPELHLVEGEEPAGATVAVVVADDVDEETARVVRSMRRRGPKVVVVATRLDDTGLMYAVEAGACAMLRRSEAEPRRLVEAVQTAAAGDGTLPPDLLGRLLENVGRLQRQVLSPRGMTLTGLTEREIDVLRLVADGLDTAEIAQRLSYSPRTIKNVIHDVTVRLNLSNRSQAVAYAVRQGLI
jgi:DNA-binding NarL/FixJ family response regulator